MFDLFKRKKSLASDPAFVLGALIRGLDHAENLLRLGKDSEAIEQLRMMALPAARALERHPHAFKALSDLFDLLLKMRQLDIAKEVMPSVERAAEMADLDLVGIRETLRSRLQIPKTQASASRQSALPKTTVIYVCQKCGAFNNYLTDACLTCGFIPIDDRAVQLALLLSNASLQAKFLPALGYAIGHGKQLENVLPDFEKNLARVPPAEVRRIANMVSAAKPRSSRYPTWTSLSKCPDCGELVTLSDEMACGACKRPIVYSPMQAFIVATGQCLNTLQRMIAPSDSPAFVPLLGMLVAFLSAAFSRGEVPSAGERLDALTLLRTLERLKTRDGAMHIIFTP
ncbi:MAG: hypothetical protein AAB401_16595, partial [Acidobacteriota bacterium]